MEEPPEVGAAPPDPEGQGASEPAGPVREEPSEGSRSTSPIGGLPDVPEARALAEEAAEIRRLVDAGAGTPEAIRELAARLREHRAREEALWRAEIKPVLRKEGRGRFRGHDRPPREEHASRATQRLALGVVALALAALVVLAASTTVWVLVLPVVALLVWAWAQGRSAGSG